MNLINNINNYGSPQEQIIFNNTPRVKVVNSLYSVFTDITQQVDLNQQKTLIASDVDQTILLDADFEEADEIFGNKLIGKSVLEENAAYNINYISQYADVILLTSRGIYTPANIDKYGIDLCTTYNDITLNNKQIQLFTINGYSFRKNVIYTYGAEKGIALKMFCDFSNTKYSNVFFIDDLKENCESVNKVLTNAGINIQTYNITIADLKENYCNLPKDTRPLSIEKLIPKQQAYFHTKDLA
jgi:glycerol-3-phosphate cytidylyltransferase-like family protein